MKKFSKFQQAHFAFDRTVKSQTYVLSAEMSEPVNEDVLRDALKKALEVFPAAAARPFITKDRHGVGMTDNNAEPLISRDSSPLALGTDETNGYLFRVIVSERTISFSIFHALFDGRGSIGFVTQVLCCYLKGMGHDIGDDGLIYSKADLSDPRVTGTMEDLLREKNITQGYADPDAPPRETLFRDMSEEELFEKDFFSSTVYAIPFAQLRKYTHELGTTPLLLFFVLMSQAMRELCDVGDRNLQCCYAADLRAKYGSRSQQEFVSTGFLYYTPETEKMPLSEQLRSAKAQLDKMISGDNLLCAVKDLLDVVNGSMAYMDLTQPEKLQPMLADAARKNSSSFYLSNMGAVRFPEDMAPYIKGFQIYGTPAKFDPNIALFTYDGTFYINYFHNSTSDAQIKRVIEKLAENGVNAELVFNRLIKLDHLGKLPEEDSVLA